MIDWGVIEQQHIPPADEREQDKSDLEEAKKIYDNAKIKQIVVFYNTATHERVVQKLDDYREEHGLKDNGEVLMNLINKHKNSKK